MLAEYSGVAAPRQSVKDHNTLAAHLFAMNKG
jgi:hypothetical protein